MNNYIDKNFHLWRINKSIDKELQQWDNKIVTRFPPEPGGALHIGHAKAVFINYIIAKKYHGTCILRFDDTNPENASTNSENMILEDIKRLGITFDKVSCTSDYFDTIISYGDYLINNGLAYVDDTDAKHIGLERKDSVESKNRNNPVDENQWLWKLMKDGNNRDSVVRIKFDMSNKNACMRDPVIFRSSFVSHHRAKHINVFPTYDFACPIVDSLEGVTHVYRSTEFSDRDEQYTEILKVLHLRTPLLSSYGKISIQDAVLSKRKIRGLISSGMLEGWSDPRLMTISGTMNRGLSLESLTNYIAHLGFSKNGTNMTPDMLWGINKKYIDKEATRYTAISTNNCIDVDVLQEDGAYKEFTDTKDILRFVRTPSLGYRKVHYSSKVLIDKTDYDELKDGEEVTLINWGNMIVVQKEGKISLQLYLQGDFKKTEKKLLWLPITKDNNNVDITIVKYGVISEESDGTYKIGGTETINMIGEPDMKSVKKGDYIQLMKMDYYICKDVSMGGDKLTIYDIPTGKNSQ